MRRVHAAALTCALVLSLPAFGSAAERVSCPDDVPRAPFADVYPLSPHAFDIDCLRWRGVTPGGTAFSPAANLTRWEMATWLDAAISWTQRRYGGQPDTFIDIGGIPGAESIEALRQIGVTKGATADRFDPYGAIPRWQMALFITRSIEASGSQLPPVSAAPFTDIGGETPEARLAINQLAATGITRGTGPGTFSPDSPVTREQMASFVARTLEYIWVLDVRVDTCDTGSSPVVCTGSRSSVNAPGLALRVSLFMADHIGSVALTESILTDPTTRVDILVDGQPASVTHWVRQHPGAVYGYWQATLPQIVSGKIEIQARIYLRGVREVDRIVTASLN